MTVRESDLPGIGKKFEIEVYSGDKLVIVVHDDGRRELYHFYKDDSEECASMITLDDSEARTVSSIIGGVAYRPKALENMDVALDSLIIEWYRIEEGSKCIGRTIGDMHIRLKTGVTIIAVIEKDGKKHINPGVELEFSEGAIVVITGERKNIKEFKNYLYGGVI